MKRRPGVRSKLLQAIWRGIALGILLGAMFTIGYLFRDWIPATAQHAPAQDFEILKEVDRLLRQHYLRELPLEREMEYAAIRGYLGALKDPFTFFIDPPVTQNESEVLAGQYGGIGVQVRRNEHGDLVLYPFRDSPAQAAGVMDGDILVAINGEAILASERLDVVDRLLRGEIGEGRGVSVIVRQPGGEPREYFIEFDLVTVPSVVWRILPEDSRLGYVQIIRFTTRTPGELKEALQDLVARGGSAFVMDLRGNSGGLLHEAVLVASEFLDGGAVFYERTRDGETITFAEPGGLALAQPLVVLVDQGTASAAELVAGALGDRERGILIGQTTYGKGSVQLIFRLPDDSSVHITSAEWYTPAHTAIDGQGIEPDVLIPPPEDGSDLELGEAIRYLQSVLESNTEVLQPSS